MQSTLINQTRHWKFKNSIRTVPLENLSRTCTVRGEPFEVIYVDAIVHVCQQARSLQFKLHDASRFVTPSSTADAHGFNNTLRELVRESYLHAKEEVDLPFSA